MAQELNQTPLYNYLYFEFPYHLFNVTAYIVFMQWVQLWAILKTQRFMQESVLSSHTEIVVTNPITPLQRPSDTLPRGEASYLSVKLSQGGRFYATMIYGISGILVIILIIDSAFCALKEIYQKDSEIFEDIFL
jgi:hypothetical protein